MAWYPAIIGPGSGGPAKVFPPLDPLTFAPQLVWLALSFGLLYLLVKRIIVPRVGEVIEGRQSRIKRDLAEAEGLQGEAMQALANHDRELANARVEAGAIAKGMHGQIAEEVGEKRAKAEAQIAQSIAEAEQRIGAAKAAALVNVGDIANEVAGAIVARLTGHEPSEDEIKRALARWAAE